MTQLVATSFFRFQNQQTITFNQLKKETTILYKLLEMKGLRKLVNNPPNNKDLANCLNQMGYKFKGDPLHPKKGSEAQIYRELAQNAPSPVGVFAKQQNIIGAHFFHEAIFATALNICNGGDLLQAVRVQDIAAQF